jgi:galactosyl transferase GMA12/MNN10 family
VNVVVCVAYSPDYEPLASITVPTIQRYCERWGFHFYLDGARDKTEGDFMKIARYQELLPRYGLDDVFVWIDTDALVMNPEIRLDHIIYHHMPPWIHYLIGCDPNGLNTGVFFVRFTPEGYRFTNAARAASKAMGWADIPGTIQMALNYPYREYVKQIPGKVFNCFLYEELGWPKAGGNYLNNYEEGDFILHFAGLPQAYRLELAQRYAR